MVHRRHVHLDMNEVLNETAFGVGLAVRGTHLLVLSSISDSIRVTRFLSHQMFKQPQISFIPTKLSFQEWSHSYNMEANLSFKKWKILLHYKKLFIIDRQWFLTKVFLGTLIL